MTAAPAVDSKAIPQLVDGIDVAPLKLGAFERFVHESIDRARSVSDIADETGLELAQVQSILRRLLELGVIAIPAAASAAATAATRVVRGDAQSAAPAVDDHELDIEEPLQKRVIAVHERLDDIDHFELLGVTRKSTRKEIKSAYYGLASTFHTDRYFGKKIGRFKPMMERVFGKITQAHDTLTNVARRAEYIDYLDDQQRTLAYERLMSGQGVADDLPIEEELQAGGSVPPSASSQPEISVSTAPLSVATMRAIDGRSSVNPSDPAIEVHPVANQAELDKQRREQLARRLAGARGGSSQRGGAARSPNASSGASPPRGTPRADPRAATEAIKRRYEETIAHTKASRAAKFIAAADEAIAKDDIVVAASQLRLAVKYTDDAALRARFEELDGRARVLMADAYVKTAKYEESQDKWGPAALAWSKAIEGRADDAELYERCANALRMEGRDLHRAARMGELGVQKNPTSPAFRVTLAQVYMDAGVLLRARTELEQALKLGSDDAKVKSLLAQLKKQVG